MRKNSKKKAKKRQKRKGKKQGEKESIIVKVASKDNTNTNNNRLLRLSSRHKNKKDDPRAKTSASIIMGERFGGRPPTDPFVTLLKEESENEDNTNYP